MSARLTLGPAPRRKIYHRAKYVNEHGDVSALCYAKPHPIDMDRATWTTSDEATTCPRCRKAIAARRLTQGE